MLTAVLLLFLGLLPLICCVSYCFRKRALAIDKAELARLAPCHVTVLQRDNHVQRELKTRVKKLCREQWRKDGYHINVMNVCLVNSPQLQCRYEQEYLATQCEQSLAANAASSEFTPLINDLPEDYKPGVLRRDEVFLFFGVQADDIRTVLEHGLSTVSASSRAVELGQISSYNHVPHDNEEDHTQYLFVVRVIAGHGHQLCRYASRNEHTGRMIHKTRMAKIFPEFLISYRVYHDLPAYVPG